MAVPFSNTKLRVPAGFRNILEGLSREVLRKQPSDIYTFGSNYFDRLVHVRAESGYDPAQIGASEEDLMYHSQADTREATSGPMSKDEVLAALKIQTKYRQHRAKMLVRRMREMKAVILIQKMFRGFRRRKMLRQRSELLRAEEQKARSAALAEDAEEEEKEGDAPSRTFIPDIPDGKQKDTEGPTDAVVEGAAETEAAAGDSAAKNATDGDEEVLVDDLEDAAVRIQAGMRGLLKRKTLAKELHEEEEEEEEGEKEEEEVQGDAGIDASVEGGPPEDSHLAEGNETSVGEGEKAVAEETAETKQEAASEGE